LIVATLSACSSGSTTPEVKYKPEFLPVELVIGPEGINVQGDARIVTPIGEFSIGANYSLPARDRGSIYVIIRDRKRGSVGYDKIYMVRAGSDQFNAVVNGTTTIQIKDGQVTIDVTAGKVKKIQFQKGTQAIPEGSKSGLATWWDKGVQKWNDGWKSSLYKPFMLSRWTYDDSTIDRWYGLGFVWFLIRLAVSLVLGIIDLILSGIFLVAQAAYWFFGATGRNIVWGVAILLFLAFTYIGFATS
jgi:hypothetical protein